MRLSPSDRQIVRKNLILNLIACLVVPTFLFLIIVKFYNDYTYRNEPDIQEIISDVSDDIITDDDSDIVELSLEEKEEFVFNILRQSGYTTEGACAIMGNIAVECPEYDPSVAGKNGVPYGLFQWNNVGSRKSALLEWSHKEGFDDPSLEGQIAFAIHELNGADSIACRLNEYLKKTTDTYTATEEFAAGFERCVTQTHERPNDAIYTGSIYPEYYGKYYQGLKKRINKAMNYYERFKDYEVIPDTSSIKQ